ncbi:TQXA domain-containing protein [Streptomyces sp. OF3]|uniref:TQXA domain-containing protein n=1 Tax=Streptomyces alkaliterrae TaxID=2213162 RepID=A0A7W3WKH4_9ACTN|nr:thioester domain-containing protein [Streptomyces alkaliterrae]MBB1254042.1 TQXA domain-containing protein [Streptomyces alkaliterrae]
MIAIRGRAAIARRVVRGVVVASGLAVATGTAAVAAPVPPAQSAAAGPAGGVVATLEGLRVYDRAIVVEDGERVETGAGLSEMSVNGGGSLQTYGVDLHTPTQEQAQYRETAWGASPLHGNPDAGRIRWIVENSYPQVNDLTALAKKAGTGRLTPQTAAAGTQVAIWRYSDGAQVEAVDKGAQKLADYLYKAAERRAEPRASLALLPVAVSGPPGGRLGPVTVRTSGQAVSLSPAPNAERQGVRVVDERGEEIRSVADGGRFWFDVPEDAEGGSTELTVQAAATVPVGRTLTGAGESTAAQVLAGSSDSTITATVVAHWAATGPLPAVTAVDSCAEGGVVLQVSNAGDEEYAFTLGEREYRVPAGGLERVIVPVAEDQPYRIMLTGPNGYSPTFAGVLDCATKSVAPVADDGLTVHSGPVTVGGVGGEPNLAETGSSGNVPLVLSIAGGLLVVGGVALLMVRRSKPSPASTPEPGPASGEESGPGASGGAGDR